MEAHSMSRPPNRARSNVSFGILLVAGAGVLGGGAIVVNRVRSKPPSLTVESYAAVCEKSFRQSKANLSATADEQTLRERLAKLSQPVEIRNVECRTSMCRIEAVVPDQNAFLREGFIVPASVWGGPMFAVPAGDRQVVFIARDGYSLPSG